jgi:hypothetical protein
MADAATDLKQHARELRMAPGQVPAAVELLETMLDIGGEARLEDRSLAGFCFVRTVRAERECPRIAKDRDAMHGAPAPVISGG